MNNSRNGYEAKPLEEFLLERHDLTERTKAQYRMAFAALTKYTDHPFSLNRKEMNEALQQLAEDFAATSWNTYVHCIRLSTNGRIKATTLTPLKTSNSRRYAAKTTLKPRS
jgi:hypothetical protein